MLSSNFVLEVEKSSRFWFRSIGLSHHGRPAKGKRHHLKLAAAKLNRPWLAADCSKLIENFIVLIHICS
jgi:hypothetical protein